MRHLKSYKNLGRETSHRMAMLRNMATSLITEGRITTTLTRAKALQPFVEKLVTLGRDNTLAAKKKVASICFTHESRKKLFTSLATRFKDRPGGYTRIIKYGSRFGDGAPICSIEFIDFHSEEGKLKREKRQELLVKKKEKQDQEASQNQAPVTT